MAQNDDETSSMSSDAESEHPNFPDSLERFTADLRELKAEAGNRTLVALETEIGISKSVLSEALSGRRLPTENTVRVLTTALGANADEWLARRALLDPRTPKPSDTDAEEPDLEEADAGLPTHRRRLGLGVLLIASTLVVSVGVTSLVWWNAWLLREKAWTAEKSKLPGNNFLEVIDGVDPMQTECREDKVVAAAEERQEQQFYVEMMYSNSCMGVWGRVTRSDGKSAGNTLSMRIYPAGDPESSRSQERSSPDVNSLYTPLLIEPDAAARVCGIATATVDGETIELGPPMCI